jgi:hypothetical protein
MLNASLLIYFFETLLLIALLALFGPEEASTRLERAHSLPARAG